MLYLLESPNYYKIGYTSDWRNRRNAYNCPDIQLVCFRFGDLECEKFLHDYCKEFRVNKTECGS